MSLISKTTFDLLKTLKTFHQCVQISAIAIKTIPKSTNSSTIRYHSTDFWCFQSNENTNIYLDCSELGVLWCRRRILECQVLCTVKWRTELRAVRTGESRRSWGSEGLELEFLYLLLNGAASGLRRRWAWSMLSLWTEWMKDWLSVG